MAAGYGFGQALERCQRESLRHQFEDDRPVFHLGAQAAHGGDKDAPVVILHRLAKGTDFADQRARAPVAAGFLDKAGLVEKLESIQRILVIETAVVAKQHAHPFGARQAVDIEPVGIACSPFSQGGQKSILDHLRFAGTPVFPREEGIPGPEGGAGRELVGAAARQGKIADGNDMRVEVTRLGMPASVAECVELLHIAEWCTGLLRHPGAQPDLEGTMCQGIEGAGGQGGFRPRRSGRDKNHRLLSPDCHNGSGETDFDRERWMQGWCHAGVNREWLHPSMNPVAQALPVCAQ